MMKRSFSIILVVAMVFTVFAFAGCSSPAPVAPAPTEAPETPEAPEAPETPSIDYPTRNITVLVPFSAGGSTDLLARIITDPLSQNLGAPMVVDNRPGGGGAIAMNALAAAAPDGYTIALTSLGPAMLTPNQGDVGYSDEEFAPITQVSFLPSMLFIGADKGFTTLAELVEAAEEDFGAMTYSTSGAGGTGHVACELFLAELGKPGLFNMVPFDSGTEATTAVLGGHIDFSFGDAGDTADYIADGTLIALAIASEERDPMFPDVPTFRELGYDVIIGPWWGFAAPAGTPEEILAILDEGIREVIEDPEVAEQMIRINNPVVYRNTAEFTAKWHEDFEMYRTIIAEIQANQ
ncbi:MAG: tripartite tricarboxylate transporter substrate binding protein [Bacillota bacterium]|nr:tripartite tricarboxylate transporter substrate binding protein [Bacillota bacterium]